VVITFSGETDGATINAANIDSALTLSGGHSWKDGSNAIGSAVWSTTTYTNDTLTITLSAATSAPTVAPTDTVTLDGTIKDNVGRAIVDSITIGGSFGSAGTMAVDNTEGAYSETWGTSTYAPGYYGTNYHYHDAASGTETFTWTPTITTAGTYRVWARWTTGEEPDTSRADDATYTIYHDDDDTSVSVTQQVNGGTWVLLGVHDFDGAGVEKVELVQSASGIVIADAIKFELEDPDEIIRDDINAAYEGAWTSFTHSELYGCVGHYHEAGVGDEKCTWTPDIPEAGDYEVYARWIVGTARATNAPYTIYYDGGFETFYVNQKEPDSGGKWNYLGTYSFAQGTGGSVELAQTDTGKVVADAVKWVRVYGSRIYNQTPPDHSNVGMTFTADFYDADGIASVQVVGNSDAGGWTYEDMANTSGDTWNKALVVNDWVELSGYYFKVTDASANVTFIGCEGERYSVEGGYADNAAAEAAVHVYQYSGLATGEVAYWKLDEGSGATADDAVGINHGTINGAAVWTTGKYDDALSFDGVDDYVDVGIKANLDFSAGFTLEAWYKPGSSSDGAIVSKISDSITDGYMLWRDSSAADKIKLYIDGGARASSISMTEGQWHHVVGTWDGSEACIYVNGILSECNTWWSTAPASSGNAFMIGGYTGEKIKASIDEVLIYNKALTADEVRDNYGTWLETALADDASFPARRMAPLFMPLILIPPLPSPAAIHGKTEAAQ
jgi:hypothetical protein